MKYTAIQAGALCTMVALAIAIPSGESQPGDAQTILSEDPPYTEERLLSVQHTAFVAPAPHYGPDRVAQKVNVIVTAYSSTPWQTDSTPFITASGTTVRDGIVAANFLPIGTRIKLPDIYGDKVFVVEDRMHPRKKYQVDVWFADTQDAINFGAKRAVVEVLEG